MRVVVLGDAPEFEARRYDAVGRTVRCRDEPSLEAGRASSKVEGLRLVRARSDREIASFVEEHTQEVLDDGASPSDIAVLCLAGRERTKICGGAAIETARGVRADDPRASEKRRRG